MKTFEQKELDDWVESIYEPVYKINKAQFLIQEIQAIKKEMAEQIKRGKDIDFKNLLEEGNETQERFNLIGKQKRLGYIEKLERKLKSYEYQLKVVQGKIKPNKDTITDEMIRRAKEYPIYEILGIPEPKGNIKCPIHNDKKPSFDLRGNHAYCYGCGWKGDTIALYQTIHSATFPEAVKYLSRM